MHLALFPFIYMYTLALHIECCVSILKLGLCLSKLSIETVQLLLNCTFHSFNEYYLDNLYFIFHEFIESRCICTVFVVLLSISDAFCSNLVIQMATTWNEQSALTFWSNRTWYTITKDQNVALREQARQTVIQQNIDREEDEKQNFSNKYSNLLHECQSASAQSKTKTVNDLLFWIQVFLL